MDCLIDQTLKSDALAQIVMVFKKEMSLDEDLGNEFLNESL